MGEGERRLAQLTPAGKGTGKYRYSTSGKWGHKDVCSGTCHLSASLTRLSSSSPSSIRYPPTLPFVPHTRYYKEPRKYNGHGQRAPITCRKLDGDDSTQPAACQPSDMSLVEACASFADCTTAKETMCRE